jgi:hypothetical protein
LRLLPALLDAGHRHAPCASPGGHVHKATVRSVGPRAIRRVTSNSPHYVGKRVTDTIAQPDVPAWLRPEALGIPDALTTEIQRHGADIGWIRKASTGSKAPQSSTTNTTS